MQIDEDKDAFYDKLSGLINKVPKHDMLIVMSDFNAKVANDNKGIERIFNQHEIGDLNQNGERLVKTIWSIHYVHSQHDFPLKEIYSHLALPWH